jgi:hypothetical protein
MIRRSALAALALLAATPGYAQEAAPASRAALVADLLARADGAADAPTRANRAALARDLDALDRLGARAADGGDDPTPAWRDRSGARAAGYRGRILGPAFRRGWIDPGAEVRVEQLFLSGQTATVAVAATPDQPLRLGVSGRDLAQLCPAGGRNCRWLPLFTQRYTISITNAGQKRARFYLVVD